MCIRDRNALRLFEELDLKGGILRIDGKIVAFTIGEPICPDTFVVHIEKAYADVPLSLIHICRIKKKHLHFCVQNSTIWNVRSSMMQRQKQERALSLIHIYSFPCQMS